uniref:Transcription activation suppressor b n=1 Tax=Astyanax mexicanus TaxID=7994 RepID=W5L8S8_ASTMX
MACNFNEDRKLDKDGVKAAGGGGLSADSGGGESQKLLSASAATTSRQNGDQAGCEDEQMSEQDAAERRRSSLSDARHGGGSPSTLQKPAEELPRKNFQIPRKIKERKGLLQMLPPDSREFEELVKVLSSFYLDAPSRGAFTYTKACLIHNELLEKEFVEKKRELKQAGRTEAELTESYAFLLPDTNKTHWICEKGLSVGHARLSNLGNPAKGVYLSKYSDLLQINPFDAGASGDIIIFKVMKGRLKSIFENMPKSNLEPAPKFDCHVHKNASKVTSLLSYRAFELTQQYFYEFAFDELKSRPRHVCPYAVVSFQYKGKESATAAHRLSSSMYEGNRVRRRYTVWSGPLVNKGEELYQVCIRSPSLPFLPLKLPDKIDISMVMHLDQVKRKIPSTLLSWDTYSGTREALKCGMYASLFEVMGKTKQGNCLSGLLQRMEREKMVLVKPLVDRGFLFLLSSSHMHSSNERRGRSDRGLQALFIFQEPRIMTRSFSKHAGHHEAVPLEPKDPITEHLHTFVPALHHAFFKLRSNPPRDLGAGVKNQALDYLGVQEQGMGRPFLVPEYRTSMDERPNLHPAPRPKGMDSALSSYMYGPSNFQLPVTRLQQGLLDSGQRGSVSPPGGGAEEYSPVSDWGGSDRASSSGRAGPAPAQSNGSAQRAQKSQTDYEKEKMEKLLKLIQLHKRARGKDDVGEPERSDEWDAAGLKRRLEGDMPSSVSKYLNTGLLSNGEQGRVPQGDKPLSLSTVMDDMGLCDTDLREQVTNSASLQDTQALLKLFLSALNKVAQGSTAAAAAVAAAADAITATPAASTQHQDSSGPPEPTTHCDRDLRPKPAEQDQTTQDYLEACSISSMDLCSPSSSIEQQPSRTSEPPSSHNRLQWRAGSTVSDSGVDVLVANKSGQAGGKMLDTILDQEFQNLCTGIQKVMDSHQILYVPQPQPPWHKGKVNGLDSTFSSYVSNYVSPPTVQTYINSLCEKMNRMIRSPGAPSNSLANPAAPTVTAPLPAPVPSSQAAAAPPSTIPAPPPALPSKPPAPKLKSNESLHKPTPPEHKPHTPSSTPSPTPAPKKHPSPTSKPPRLGTVKEVHMAIPGKKTDPKVPNIAESPVCLPSAGIPALPLIPELPPDPAQVGGSNVIGQIKPEVLCTLMEIMQMNAVRFYIKRGDQDENELCTEIKVYLQSLGNIECDPQTYLENNCQQKFMVIIQNEDIATHVHKIPALVSLKKLSTVYFAGVDSLDDVKNRTYNELFVSGGLIVSDELILSPDYITLEKMQMFLQFLESQNLSWKWKVHCKTQKKLKELSRLNSEALDLLNLLTIYQKKHLVEFLPYHECDAPSRQAPDLDCLVKLQAQHSQLRHIIFLTDKPFDVSKFSSNGIMIASITDIMTNFESLISSTKSEVPALLAPAETDACVGEEDMSLDSDEDATSASVVSKNTEEERTSLPPLPQSEEFRPPLPELPVQDPLSSFPVDYNVLKLAISEYKASRQSSTSSADLEDSLTSFGVNPHQSYLYPSSAQWSPYSGSPGYHVGSAYSSPACSTSQGQELSQASTMSITQGSAAAAAVPLSQTSSLLQAIPSTLPPLNPSTLHPANSALLPPASNSPLPVPQASTGSIAEALPVPQATSCPQAQADDAMVALTSSISQVVQNKAIESTALTSSSSSSSSSLPTYPEPSMFPALTPIPPVPPMPILNWAAAPGPHQSYPPGVNRGAFGPLPSLQNEAARTPSSSAAVNPLWAGAGDCATPKSKVEGSTPGSASSTVPLQEAGLEKGSTPESLMPGSQGSRTPLNSCSESHGVGPPQPHAGGLASGRGGGGGAAAAAIPRGLLPLPGAVCRGGPQGMGSHGSGGGGTYGPRGPMPGLMDMMRGGYRGRGPPPMPMRSRPSRGPMRGSCNWGYPSGRGGGGVPDYYSDHPYP